MITVTMPARTRTPAPWPSVAGFAVVLAGLGIVQLHVAALQQSQSLVQTLSVYVYLRQGWLFPASLVALAVGVFALAVALVRAGSAARTGCVPLLGAAGLGALAAAIFRTDRPTVAHMSWHGDVHRYASFTMLAAPLLAGLLLARRLAGLAGRWVLVLVSLGVVGAALFLVGAVPADTPMLGALASTPITRGIGQRLLVAAVAALLIVLAGCARRALPAPESRPAMAR